MITLSKNKKILITSIGSLVGQNILEVLKYRDFDFSIIGVNSVASAPIYGCDKVYLVTESNLSSSNIINSLSNIIQSESPDLIIPARDIDVIIISILRDYFRNMNGIFLAGEKKLAEIMEDKYLSFQFAKEEGLPFAETAICDFKNNKMAIDQLIDRYGFPLILKPINGFASKNVSIVCGYNQLRGLNSPDMILQEYLGDIEKVAYFRKRVKSGILPLFYSLEEAKFSFQFYIDQSKKLIGKCSTIHKMKNGVSLSVENNLDENSDSIIKIFYNAFQKNGWYGPVNIQMQKDFRTGEIKAYEFNGRFTGATAARYFLGYDEIGFALEEAGIELNRDSRFGSQKIVTKMPVVSIVPDIMRLELEKNRELTLQLSKQQLQSRIIDFS